MGTTRAVNLVSPTIRTTRTVNLARPTITTRTLAVNLASPTIPTTLTRAVNLASRTITTIQVVNPASPMTTTRVVSPASPTIRPTVRGIRGILTGANVSSLCSADIVLLLRGEDLAITW